MYTTRLDCKVFCNFADKTESVGWLVVCIFIDRDMRCFHLSVRHKPSEKRIIFVCLKDAGGKSGQHRALCFLTRSRL